MVFQASLDLRVFQTLIKGLESEGFYSFDLKPTRQNLRVYKVGNVIRVLEHIESEFHPIKTPKGEETQHKRILHRPTGKEVRLVVKSIEPSVSEGYIKVTMEKED